MISVELMSVMKSELRTALIKKNKFTRSSFDEWMKNPFNEAYFNSLCVQLCENSMSRLSNLDIADTTEH